MAYPSFSGPLATLTFAKGDVYPSRSPEDLHQIKGVSEGGQVRVWTMTDPEQFLIRAFERMPQEDKDDFEAWVHDPLINGGANTFTFTDTDGTAYTVRYWDNQFDPAQVAFELWSWVVTLRVEVA